MTQLQGESELAVVAVRVRLAHARDRAVYVEETGGAVLTRRVHRARELGLASVARVAELAHTLLAYATAAVHALATDDTAAR